MNARGFTLIEMSIVLAVIGLITGGIFIGQSLIRQSQIGSAIADEQKYVQAALNFQQKFGQLPGDFNNATTYWGAMSTCPPTAGMASPGGTLTCNGDGNGWVQMTSNDEMFLFWQHLVNAGMIQGKYIGIPSSMGMGDHTPGINCPATKIDGGGFGINWEGVSISQAGFFDASYGHIFTLGSKHTATAGSTPDYALLTTTEASALDTKYDDGYPGTGNILTYTSAWTSCSTTTSSATARYNMSATGQACSLLFISGF